MLPIKSYGINKWQAEIRNVTFYPGSFTRIKMRDIEGFLVSMKAQWDERYDYIHIGNIDLTKNEPKTFLLEIRSLYLPKRKKTD